MVYNLIEKLIHRTQHGSNISDNFFSGMCSKMGYLHCQAQFAQIDTVRALELSKSGSHCVTASGNGQILLWSIENVFQEDRSKAILMEPRNRAFVYCLALSPDNSHILAGGYQNVVIYDFQT